MSLYIELQDGVPINHPIYEWNLLEVFGTLDFTNRPEKFVPFHKASLDTLGTFEVVEGSEYKLIDGVVKEFLITREMTEEEKEQKILLIIENKKSQVSELMSRTAKTLAILKEKNRPEMAMILEDYIKYLRSLTDDDLLHNGIVEYPEYVDRTI